ncbi:DUF4190 domain-containing protein [Salininema proteolyticum]|uniref:DUF4190 domain-containing protein n=1 Tax=Salininema proteolyticum TaxID=1607685 RepID=A0ABV8TW29_9ACTN
MASKPKGFGITALVCGIAALALSFVPVITWFSWPLNIVAIVFGVLGWDRANKGLASGKGPAIAGLVLGLAAFFVMCALSTWTVWTNEPAVDAGP